MAIVRSEIVSTMYFMLRNKIQYFDCNGQLVFKTNLIKNSFLFSWSFELEGNEGILTGLVESEKFDGNKISLV